MNPTEQEFCQSCAACCKVMWTYVYDKDSAERWAWLDTDLVTVKKITESEWRIQLNIPCKKLKYENGKYSCSQYNGHRPSFCVTYPRNFLETDCPEYTRKDMAILCPLLKQLIKVTSQ